MAQMMTRKLSFLPFALVSLLFIPLIAMQLSDEVNWSMGDFIMMGALLLGLGYGIIFIAKQKVRKGNRAFWIILLILAFLLLWAEMAVGVFGSPLAGS